MSNQVIYGIEVEGVYNKTSFKSKMSDRYGYRISSGTPVSESWVASSDSSLNSSGTNFGSPVKLEMIQQPRIGIDAFNDSLHEFQGLFKDNLPLNDCVEFNNSTGCHVHFSTNVKIHTRCLFEHTTLLKTTLKAQLIDRGLRTTLVNSIMGHYNRGYAPEIKEDTFERDVSGESDERKGIYFKSEQRGKGVEWRAFNLKGVKTWEEFYTVMECMTSTLDIFLNTILKYKKVDTQVFDPKKFAKVTFARPVVKMKIPKLGKFAKKNR